MPTLRKGKQWQRREDGGGSARVQGGGAYEGETGQEADLREEGELATARGWKQEELAGAVRHSAIGAGLRSGSGVNSGGNG